MKKQYVKSPLNYIGGKFKLLPQIIPLFPKKINTFIDLFGGGFNVGINVNANKIIYNDINTYIVELFQVFKEKKIEEILRHIEMRIDQYKLSKENEEGFKKFREYYNNTKIPLDLYVLVCYSFNYQIRFNNNHQYNNPFGRNKSRFSPALRKKLIKFVETLHTKNIDFYNEDFCNFDYSKLSSDDLVYCDPPYLITTGTYNDGKRGFKGWSEKEEIQLINTLDKLNERGVKFVLSNVLEHKGKENEILRNWSNKYYVHDLNYNYANCNYQSKNKSKHSTREVLITNYKVEEEYNNNIVQLEFNLDAV